MSSLLTWNYPTSGGFFVAAACAHDVGLSDYKTKSLTMDQVIIVMLPYLIKIVINNKNMKYTSGTQSAICQMTNRTYYSLQIVP
jgi:hypothetical protein